MALETTAILQTAVDLRQHILPAMSEASDRAMLVCVASASGDGAEVLPVLAQRPFSQGRSDAHAGRLLCLRFEFDERRSLADPWALLDLLFSYWGPTSADVLRRLKPAPFSIRWSDAQGMRCRDGRCAVETVTVFAEEPHALTPEQASAWRGGLCRLFDKVTTEEDAARLLGLLVASPFFLTPAEVLEHRLRATAARNGLVGLRATLARPPYGQGRDDALREQCLRKACEAGKARVLDVLAEPPFSLCHCDTGEVDIAAAVVRSVYLTRYPRCCRGSWGHPYDMDAAASLETLVLRCCPLLTDVGVCAIAHACRLCLHSAQVTRCQKGTGRGLLVGLRRGCDTTAVLPLEFFQSDTLCPSELCEVFSHAGTLFGRLQKLWLPRVHAEDEGDSSAVIAIAQACAGLVDLWYGSGVPALGVETLSKFCQLRHLRVLSGDCLAGFAGTAALESLSVSGDVSITELSDPLAACSERLAKLSLGTHRDPLHLTLGLAQCIARLRNLRTLVLMCWREPSADPSIVSELSTCAPLEQLGLAGLSLTEQLVTGPACSELIRASFMQADVSDAVLALLGALPLRLLSLIHCTGYSVQGLLAALQGTSSLQTLALREPADGPRDSDDVAFALTAFLATSGKRLGRMDVELPGLTDTGASSLAMVVSRLQTLRVRAPLLTEHGAAALLASAREARSVDVGLCARLDVGALVRVGPAVRKVVLAAALRPLVYPAVTTLRPTVLFAYV
eukprot:m51a1_g14774 hypothetical protein (735) ;mRNA; f:423210-426336